MIRVPKNTQYSFFVLLLIAKSAFSEHANTESLSAETSAYVPWVFPQPVKITDGKKVNERDIRNLCIAQNFSGSMPDPETPYQPRFSPSKKRSDEKTERAILDESNPMGLWHQIMVPNSKLRGNFYSKVREARYSYRSGCLRDKTGQAFSYCPQPYKTKNIELWRAAADQKSGLTYLKTFPKIDFWQNKTNLTYKDRPSDVSLYGLCGMYGCPEAGSTFSKMADDLQPEGRNVDMNTIRSTLSVDENLQVIAASALVIDKKIQDANRGFDITGNVFDDILNVARRYLGDEKRARDLTWKILGIYGTRGANMAALVDALEAANGVSRQEIAITALQGIAVGMNVLDQIQQDRGKNMYSLPADVKFDCAYGKPYHFWMAAYLAQKYTKQGTPSPSLGAVALGATPAEKAALSVHLLSLGYNFMSQSRDPSAAFTEPDLGENNNMIRLSIAFADAGGRYGAYRANGERLGEMDINAAARQMFKNQVPRAPSELMKKKDFEKEMASSVKQPLLFLKWRQFIGADAAYDYLKNLN